MDRTYQRGDLSGAATHVISLSRIYPQASAAVWAAFTDAARLSRWFLPVTGDLRLGGSFQFEGNAGGVIEACEEPSRIAVTWGMMGSSSWVELTFAPEGAGTRVTLRHTVKAGDLPPGMWDRFGPGAVGAGWEGGFRGLEIFLDDPSAVWDPARKAAFPGSREGHAFFCASAEAWAEAAIAGGEDAQKMRATVPTLVGFYTGKPA